MTRLRFTMVELMVVVAVVAILVAVAIPALHTMQLKAKVAELEPNVEGIYAAQVAYMAAHDAWVTAMAAHPVIDPGKAAHPWLGGGGWDELGWSPDGGVRAQYDVDDWSGQSCRWEAGGIGNGSMCGPVGVNMFCAFGRIDVDADNYDRCYGVSMVTEARATIHRPNDYQARY